MSLGPDVFGTGMSTNCVGIPTSDDGFVEREGEVERIIAALSTARVVTLVGPGGIGKTRLASTVTARLRQAGQVPAYWVHLARLPQNAPVSAVEEEMVTAVLEGDFSHRTGLEALIDTIGRTGADGQPLPSVLVLDNCEHVLDSVGHVVSELLAAAPGLVVLATSRTVIGWVDERIVSIPPLAREQAVALFRQRAELAGRSVPDAEVGVVEQICHHLHYYPLHIRLAAARLRYQSLSLILRDLDGDDADRRLRWSPGFRVGQDERHRDINAVIAWSFELCSPKERLLFERLSVFAAGYDINPDDVDGTDAAVLDIGADIDAIEAVCADTDRHGLAAHEIQPLLERLVDRSLVALHLGQETARYSLLESFRVFAYERIAERDDDERRVLAIRHLHHYRDQVRTLCTGWVSSEEQRLLASARAEWDNVTKAIATSLSAQAQEAATGVEMAVGLISSRLPFLRGSLREFRRLVEDSLVVARARGLCPPELEVSAHAWIGWLSVCQGLPDEAERILDQCVVNCVGPAAHAGWREDPTVDIGLPPEVEYLWGSILLLAAGDPAATDLLARARVKLTAAGSHGGAAMAALFEALSAGFFGDTEQALRVTEQHLNTTLAAGAQWAISHAQFARAIALAAHGDPNQALALANAGLARQIPMRDQWCCVWGVHIRAWSQAELIIGAGVHTPADEILQWASDIAQVSGSIEPVRRQIGLDVVHLKPFAARTHKAIDTARKVLGGRAFDAMAREGEQMPNVVALAESLVAPRQRPPARPTLGSGESGDSGWAELTGAEQEVAVLAAAGFTNVMIGTRRGTSTRTVDAQLASILSKLMINSRKDILPLLSPEEREIALMKSRRQAPRQASR
ncbi:AAA family ATPase [Nocardia tengchongensis]|uniref:helix-turn-helix transcriptional regulator n=1 Tax=Nocardia tengchongensis TaxID=2055889 RepID=UPI00367FF38E